MIDPLKNTLFTLNVLNLLKPDYLTLLEAFQCQWVCLRWVVSMLDQPNPTKGTCSQGRNEVEIVEVEITCFFPLGTAVTFLCVVVAVHFGVV